MLSWKVDKAPRGRGPGEFQYMSHFFILLQFQGKLFRANLSKNSRLPWIVVVKEQLKKIPVLDASQMPFMY